MPMPSPTMPNRRRATSSSRHTMTTARDPVLLFAYDLGYTRVPEVPERLGGMFEQTRLLRRLRRRHRGRQVDQPLGVGGEAAEHLECRDPVLLTDRDRVVQPSRDQSLTGDVGDVQQVVMDLLRGQWWLRGLRANE